MQSQQIKEPIQLLWSRISFSRLTLIYFVFSVVHCVLQVAFQIRAFTVNIEAYHALTQVVTTAETYNSSVPYLKDSHLHMCSWIPSNLNTNVTSCPTIWKDSSEGDAKNNSASNLGAQSAVITPLPALTVSRTTVRPSTPVVTSSVASTASTSTLMSSTRVSLAASIASKSLTSALSASPTTITVLVVPKSTAAPKMSTPASDEAEHHDDNARDDDRRRNLRRDLQVVPSTVGGSISATVSGLKGQGDVVLDEQCLWSLNWPRSVLHNTKREDVVFIAFQFWVLGMSIIALLHESIPHIIASLVTHLMATSWGGFQIAHTANFRSTFHQVITNGACKGAVFLPGYWDARAKAEIPSLVFNGVALIISGVLTWKLMKSFGWQTFKRVGASLTINRIYKLVLLLSITIQLSLFFMAVTVGLWIDQLMNSVIGDKTPFIKAFLASSFITLALLLPWFICGWLGVRKELKLPMLIFLLLSTHYMTGWGFMFFSTTFRWTFVTWRFFSIMATASILMTLVSVILGIICRLNFGKGLSRYLNGEQALPDEHVIPYTISSSDDLEKVAFPSPDMRPLPTFAAFDNRGPSSAASADSGRTLGPRFVSKGAEPFETNAGVTAYPSHKRDSDSSSFYESRMYDAPATPVTIDNPFVTHSRTNSGNSSHTIPSQGIPKQRWIIA